MIGRGSASLINFCIITLYLFIRFECGLFFFLRRGQWSLSRRKSIFRDIERNLAGKRDNTRNISFSISFFYMLYLGNVDNFLDSVTHKHTFFSFY